MCYILSNGVSEDITLTLPPPSDIVNQFYTGKSFDTTPMIYVINEDDTYNLIVEAADSAESSTFYYSVSFAKEFILPPRKMALLIFVDPDWYVLESL
jgi:hypothetical protein